MEYKAAKDRVAKRNFTPVTDQRSQFVLRAQFGVIPKQIFYFSLTGLW